MKKQNLCIAVLILSAVSGVFALDEQIVLGGQDLWESLSELKGAKLVTGREGFPDVVLADSEYEARENTDLLMHFNTSPPVEETSRYRTLPADIRITPDQARLGGGAAVFQSGGNGVSLTALPGAFLAPGSISSNFTIEFWLYPASLQEGETVLLWNGARLLGTELQRQELRCTVINRSLVWSFLNFFLPATGEEFLLTLTPHSSLIPRQWHHHMIRFDADSGLVEYLVDDRTEAVGFATESGKEHPSVYLPRVGESSRGNFTIAPSFTGFFDELRITRGVVSGPVLRKYQDAAGSAVTKVMDLKHANSRVLSIGANVDTPDNSAVSFSYRTADVKNGNGSIPGEWIPFVPGRPLPGNVRGRFVQLRFELYTDGRESVTPRVSKVTLRYEPDLPPSPPSRLTAVPGDGSVTLRWSAVPESDVAGYLVYYGTKPGVYFGTNALEGASPIDVGSSTSCTLSGLVNGRLYYFSIAAYDSSPVPHTGEFSRETNARPSRVYQ